MGVKLEEFVPAEESVKVSELEPDFWAGFDRVDKGVRKIGFTKAGTLVCAKSYKKGRKYFQFRVHCRHEMEESSFFLEFALLTPAAAEKYLEKNYSHPDFISLSLQVRDGDMVGLYCDFSRGIMRSYVNGIWQPGRKDGTRVLNFEPKEPLMPVIGVTSVFLKEYIFDFSDVGSLPDSVGDDEDPLPAFLEDQEEKLSVVNAKANNAINKHKLEATADISLRIEAGLGDVIEFDMPEDTSLGMRWVFDLDNTILVEDEVFRKEQARKRGEWCNTRILCDSVGTTELRFGNCMLKKHNLTGLSVTVTVYKDAPARSSPVASPRGFLGRGSRSLKGNKSMKQRETTTNVNEDGTIPSPRKSKSLFSRFRK